MISFLLQAHHPPTDVLSSGISLTLPRTGKTCSLCSTTLYRECAFRFDDVLTGIHSPLHGVFRTCTTKDLISFRLLAAMLRLGDKYNGHNVRQEALKFLRYEFPQNLEDWMGVWGTKVFPYPESEFDFINLAQEVGLHSVLPAMYYTCVKYEKLVSTPFFYD